MSQENVELVHRCVDAFNRRDLDALLTLMDDDVEVAPPLASMEGNHRGHDGVRRWWENVFEGLPDCNVEVVAVRDLGDLTVAVLLVRAHGAASDAPVEAMLWHIGGWRRGKAVWWRFFAPRAEALEAVGLWE